MERGNSRDGRVREYVPTIEVAIYPIVAFVVYSHEAHFVKVLLAII